MSRSSRRIHDSAPGSPFWACLGAWWVDVLKWVLPEPATTAARDHRALTDGDEVRQQLAGLVEVDRGAGRDVEGQVVAGPAVPPRARAPAAGGRPEVVPMVEVAQGRLPGIDPQVDRAATTAVAAVGAAARDVRLLPEGRGPVATVTGADPDLHAVEEHRGHSRTVESDPRPAGRVGDDVGLEVAKRVDAAAAVPDRPAPDLEVEVRAGRVATLADPADLLAPGHGARRRRP